MHRFLLLMVAAIGLAAGCARQAAPGETSPQGGPPRAPTVLTVAIQQEPSALVPGIARSTTNYLVHRELGAWDRAGDWIPLLAAELPSPQQGTWRVNADGSMDTVWRIRPDLVWHDGAPFTSADLLFALDVYRAPEATPPDGSAAQLIESAVALDPLSISIHWSAVYVDADKAPNMVPLPRHLLEERFRAGWDSYASSPYLRTEFVGLGPFEMSHWEPGSHAELRAFDRYYLGNPRLDRIILRFIGDANTMIANLQAGTVDVITGGAQVVTPIAIAVEREQRQGGLTPIRLGYSHAGNLLSIELQHRAEYARPTNGLPNRLVRQALTHATDRQAYTEVITEGKAPPVDSWIGPRDPLRRQVEGWIPQFPYDPRRAQELLREAGWIRGEDDVLVHDQSGERFETNVRTNQGGGAERITNVIADMWKAVGVRAEPGIVPAARQSDLEYRVTQPGAFQGALNPKGFYGGRLNLHSKLIASPDNRWSGMNRTGYANPRVDAILDRLVTTIDPAARLPLHRELLQTAMADAPLIPLHIGISVTVYAERVTGFYDDYVGQDSEGINVHEWDKKSN